MVGTVVDHGFQIIVLFMLGFIASGVMLTYYKIKQEVENNGYKRKSHRAD
jgi:hypothetical protein